MRRRTSSPASPRGATICTSPAPAASPLTTPQIQSLIAGATATAGNTTLTLSPTHTVTINNLAPAQLTQAAFV